VKEEMQTAHRNKASGPSILHYSDKNKYTENGDVLSDVIIFVF